MPYGCNLYEPDLDMEPRFWRAYPRSKGTGSLGSNKFCSRHPIGGSQYGTWEGSLRFHGRDFRWGMNEHQRTKNTSIQN